MNLNYNVANKFYNLNTENPLHKDLLEDLHNDPIIKKFVKLPDDYERRIGIARGLQFTSWNNRSGLTGQWIASVDFNYLDIKNYYHKNVNTSETKDVFICYPIIVQNMDPIIICRTYNEESFDEIETFNPATWASIYERNKGRIEADFVVFSLVILFGTVGKYVYILISAMKFLLIQCQAFV